MYSSFLIFLETSNDCEVFNPKFSGWGGCSPYATCLNANGSRTCHCQRGFAGTGIGPDGCQDIDDCTTDNGGCNPVARCYDAGGPRVCVCPNNQQGTGVGRYPCYSLNEVNCQNELSYVDGMFDGGSELPVGPLTNVTKSYRPCAENAICRPMTTKEQLETGNGTCVGCRDCFCREGFVGDGWNHCVQIGIMKEEEKLQLEILYVSPTVSAVETVETDAAAELTCIAAGVPMPRVEWRQKGIALGNARFEITTTPKSSSFGNRTEVSFIESILKIHNVRLNDAGSYACVARNKAGEKVKATQLDVTRKLVFRQRPKDLIAVPGGNITLQVIHFVNVN